MATRQKFTHKKATLTPEMQKLINSFKVGPGKKGQRLSVEEREKLLTTALDTNPEASVQSVIDLVGEHLRLVNRTGISTAVAYEFANKHAAKPAPKFTDGTVRMIPASHGKLPTGLQKDRDAFIKAALKDNPGMSMRECQEMLEKEGLAGIGYISFSKLKNGHSKTPEMAKQPSTGEQIPELTINIMIGDTLVKLPVRLVQA